jgi:hypothetical protein
MYSVRGTLFLIFIFVCSFGLILSDPKQAEHVIKEALEIARKLPYQKGISEALVFYGFCLQLRNDDQRLPILRQGIAGTRKIGETGIEGYG